MRCAGLLMILVMGSTCVAWGVDIDARTLEDDKRTLRTIRVGTDARRRPVRPSQLPPGDSVFTIHRGGYLRDYELHVPPSYDGEPVPLVVDLHAFGDTGTVQRNASGFLEKSDEEGFIVAWPTGLERSWSRATASATPTRPVRAGTSACSAASIRFTGSPSIPTSMYRTRRGSCSRRSHDPDVSNRTAHTRGERTKCD